MDKWEYITRSGRSTKRPSNLNISLGNKKWQKPGTPFKKSTPKRISDKEGSMATAEIEKMRAQLQAQQQELENARRAMTERTQAQQAEVDRAREQCAALQRERDEA